MGFPIDLPIPKATNSNLGIVIGIHLVRVIWKNSSREMVIETLKVTR